MIGGEGGGAWRPETLGGAWGRDRRGDGSAPGAPGDPPPEPGRQSPVGKPATLWLWPPALAALLHPGSPDRGWLLLGSERWQITLSSTPEFPERPIHCSLEKITPHLGGFLGSTFTRDCWGHQRFQNQDRATATVNPARVTGPRPCLSVCLSLQSVSPGAVGSNPIHFAPGAHPPCMPREWKCLSEDPSRPASGQ